MSDKILNNLVYTTQKGADVRIDSIRLGFVAVVSYDREFLEARQVVSHATWDE